MPKVLTQFWIDEDGAVTVDWVVLTAAIVGLSIAVIASISAGALDQANGIGANLSAQTVATY
ncbi:MAG: Flp family type IVb pilin [Paracoccaceae bacterium]